MVPFPLGKPDAPAHGGDGNPCLFQTLPLKSHLGGEGPPASVCLHSAPPRPRAGFNLDWCWCGATLQQTQVGTRAPSQSCSLLPTASPIWLPTCRTAQCHSMGQLQVLQCSCPGTHVSTNKGHLLHVLHSRPPASGLHTHTPSGAGGQAAALGFSVLRRHTTPQCALNNSCEEEESTHKAVGGCAA